MNSEHCNNFSSQCLIIVWLHATLQISCHWKFTKHIKRSMLTPLLFWFDDEDSFHFLLSLKTVSMCLLVFRDLSIWINSNNQNSCKRHKKGGNGFFLLLLLFCVLKFYQLFVPIIRPYILSNGIKNILLVAYKNFSYVQYHALLQ